jgi:hypothetical protein
MIGLVAGAFFAPIIAAPTVSFDKRRGLAVALVSAGMGEVCLRCIAVVRRRRSKDSKGSEAVHPGAPGQLLVLPVAPAGVANVRPQQQDVLENGALRVGRNVWSPAM